MPPKIVRVKKFESYLQDIFGYSSFREGQRDIIEAVVKQRVDVCCVMATSHGKSVCYQLPAIIMKRPSIVISPLLSLMEDQRINLEKVGVMACCYNSSIVNKTQLKIDILAGKYQVIYTTPESVVGLQELLQSIHTQLGISVIAIDEAHCVSLWGNTFRSSYLQLACLRDWLPGVPILALTGTATAKVEEDIITLLKLSNPIRVRTSSDRPNLSYYVHSKTNPVADLAPHLVNKKSAIIYCQTRKDTEKFTELLKNVGIACEAYHAGLSNEVRTDVHHKFITDEITCIIATISFGMGIDKRDIRKIIHYGSPKDVESYYQEIGRSGRDGQPSQCHVYYSPNDFAINRSFLKDVHDPIMMKYKETMIGAIEKYLYTTECRRQVLLEYFGESKVSENPVCCDNCQSQSQLVVTDIGNETKIFLELVNSFSGKLGKVSMINVIRGGKTKDFFTKHPNYGIGQNHSSDWWRNCVQYMINDDLVHEKIMSSGFGSVLWISEKGIRWLATNQTDPSFKIKSFNTSQPSTSTQPSTSSTPTPRRQKQVVTKTGVNKTQMATYELFHQGISIKEIAKTRDLTPKTIEDHLAKCLENGLECDLEQLIISKDIYDAIISIIDSSQINGDISKLAPIKNICPSKITYAQIKYAIAIRQSGTAIPVS
jgi:Werner syndrome ATP-dependent helicase